MEKRKPHYKLSEIQTLVANLDSQPFTAAALRNGLAYGLDGTGDAAGDAKAFPRRFLQGNDFIF